MSNHDILIVALSTAITATAAISTLLQIFIRQSKRAHYDEARHRVEMESLRKSLEERIYALNDQLTATITRWQDTNHLILSGQRADALADSEQKRQPKLEFLKQAGVSDEDYDQDPKLVFVLIPFHPDFLPLYEAVRRICLQHGFVCLRGDEHYVKGDLLSHVLKLIVKARLVIAVLDGRNPNVFYELGIAHALGKPVLSLAKSSEPIESVPIDVRNNRILFYTKPDDLRYNLGAELTKALIAN